MITQCTEKDTHEALALFARGLALPIPIVIPAQVWPVSLARRMHLLSSFGSDTSGGEANVPDVQEIYCQDVGSGGQAGKVAGNTVGGSALVGETIMQ
jgi:hypothetical protein